MLSKHPSPYRRSLVTVLAAALLLQIFIFTRFHAADSVQRQSQPQTASLHESVGALFTANVTPKDFGLKGKKVAALAELAKHYQQNPFLPTASLEAAVIREFPWWNPDKLQYVPWRTRSWFKSWSQGALETNIGIVLCVGEKNAWEAGHLIVTLRNVLRSKLPVEVAYGGDEDLSPRTRAFLQSLGSNLHFIDLAAIYDDNLVGLSGWAMKPFALLASRFARTILVDADVVFFSKPDNAFDEHSSLRETGTLFYHDRCITMYWTHGRQAWLNEELNNAERLPSSRLNDSSLFFRGYVGEEADSAVVFVDRSRPELYLSMVFAAWMNTEEIRDSFTYQMFYGDKETYWLATELSGSPYSFEPYSAALLAECEVKSDDEHTIASASETTTIRTCTNHMAHANAAGDAPFWANAAVWKDKNYKNLGFVNWTHWFLGDGIADAINAAKPPSMGSFSATTGDQDSASVPVDVDGNANGSVTTDDGSAEKMQRLIMSTQPDWGAGAGCTQHDESKWRELSPGLQTTLKAVLAEAHAISKEYHKAVES
ncbi:hypothetical protein LTR10_014614 [Elasticomyces elasticus]|uniref:Uncharacterized protein n=1 Tax=Exophiala sideris TaxID=1016849 RepID=A0ABR0JU73_9EURO|nr:hypothetical protein LTR10_014614 [Elasticomyces elasticus]KAK5040591.1 hypothetical protein LTS07_001091 [Exophiala sideris]KAK5042984.1 hypothetical protein LTR13_000754 [Exophiala sideris]KAK5068969.1 hypothetical protein LTR69_001092 [Exophiala sideris]KAK5186566.1 hypothetical protein LTR44_001623 [Eurotiomycetes sp. CCFEE 6388]